MGCSIMAGMFLMLGRRLVQRFLILLSLGDTTRMRFPTRWIVERRRAIQTGHTGPTSVRMSIQLGFFDHIPTTVTTETGHDGVRTLLV